MHENIFISAERSTYLLIISNSINLVKIHANHMISFYVLNCEIYKYKILYNGCDMGVNGSGKFSTIFLKRTRRWIEGVNFTRCYVHMY